MNSFQMWLITMGAAAVTICVVILFMTAMGFDVVTPLSCISSIIIFICVGIFVNVNNDDERL